jgi:hypothetical protein
VILHCNNTGEVSYRVPEKGAGTLTALDLYDALVAAQLLVVTVG